MQLSLGQVANVDSSAFASCAHTHLHLHTTADCTESITQPARMKSAEECCISSAWQHCKYMKQQVEQHK